MISKPKVLCNTCHRLYDLKGLAHVGKGGVQATFYARCGCGCRLLTFTAGSLTEIRYCPFIPPDAKMDTGDDPDLGYYQDYTPA